MFSWLCRWFLGRCKRATITNADGVPYMHRYYVMEWPWRVRIHEILRSDEDRDLHDHPYDFVTFMLKGGYIETAPMTHNELEALYAETATHTDPCSCEQCAFLASGPPLETRKHYGVGSIRRLRAEGLHRIELNSRDGKPLPAWTLIFAGPVRREWGFKTENGWMHWKAYLDKKFGKGQWQSAELELRKEMD